jgi:hypothetical protein
MQVLADISPGVQLVGDGFGDFAGTAQVEQLQRSLQGLAMAAGWPAVNPGAVTGDVTPQTVMAVSQVVSHLGGKVSSKVKTALQIGLAVASTNTSAMAAAKNLVQQYAGFITPGVVALTAKYTGSALPPAPPPPPSITPMGFFPPMQKATIQPAVRKSYPAGSIQARTASGSFRVAVPASQAAGLGGPALALGAAAFFEVSPRPTAATGVRLVSEKEFDNKTGATPFFKRPLVLASIGLGVVGAGVGGYFLLRK